MTATGTSASDIAIIGMAGQFPGARDLDGYWENLRAGVESITFFSAAELLASGVEPEQLDRPDYVRAAPVLDDPSLFDAAFFGYAPHEAEAIDPQQRLFLECAWTALEHAGYDPLHHDRPIGVYGGSAINSYLLFGGLWPRLSDEYLLTLTSSDKDFLATRVSYKLNLTGPSITVQTACSTSLVAVHLARQSLLDGECAIALAGGVAVRVPHRVGHLHAEGGILSPDGHCRPFDAAAGGTIFGSGAGIVVLKRLSDALGDRDTIFAVIKGSAVNNDGAAKASYATPSVTRQAAAVVEALGNAGVDPTTISYVEAHGTGTRIGDPIEIAALTQAFRTFTSKTGFCSIGSVKSNIGHLDAAAGVAGLIKTVLALQHAEIPASLHFHAPNPEIDFASTPFRVNDRLSPWPSPSPSPEPSSSPSSSPSSLPSSGPSGAHPRRAAVNALGVGGTNVHVILEEAPPGPGPSPSRPVQLLVLSGKTATALGAATSALAGHLERHPDQALADVAYTLQIGRPPFPHRRVVLCRDRAHAVDGLRSLDPRRVWTARCTREAREVPEARDVAYLVPGQGAQRAGMGLELYRTEPVFRASVDRCAELFRRHLSADLREVLYPGDDRPGDDRPGDDRPGDDRPGDDRLDQTSFAQPALFTLSCALAGLWSSWGLRPVALLGHSLGELVTAHLAGVFSLEDAVSLVAARGRLMQALPPGAMLAVPLSQAALSEFLDGGLALAGVNGPSQCVVAGEIRAVRALAQRLGERGVAAHLLPVSRAFHSPMMDPIVEPFREHVHGVRRSPPTVPFVSNLTGTWIRPEEAMAPEYWARQLRHTVRLGAGLRTLAERAAPILLEVGPGRVLCGLARQALRVPAILPSLPPPDDGRTELEGVMSTLGRLWAAGADIDWARFAAGEQRRRVPLPTYAFERRRCWVEPDHVPEHGEHGERREHRGRAAASRSIAPTAVPIPERDPRAAPPDPPMVTPDTAPDSDASGTASGTAWPRTPAEAAIIAVWQAVLGSVRIGVRDNFYRIGGHSIMIPDVVRRLGAIFQIDLPALTLVEAPTVEELAERIEAVFRLQREAASRQNRRRA